MALGPGALHAEAESAPGPAASVAPAGEVGDVARTFQAAHRAFEAGDYETARRLYEETYRLSPHPNALYNLALSCERMLDFDAAIAAFERFLAQPVASDPEAARAQKTRRLLAERALGRLRGLPARVSVSGVPDPMTAVIRRLPSDGSAAAAETREQTTPCIFTLPAGRYRLSLERPGYEPEQVEIDAHVGQALLISRQLRPKPRTVLIDAQPRARLVLDDQPLGETPFRGEIPLGTHRLRLEHRFYLTQLRSLPLTASPSPLSLKVALVPSGRLDMLLGGALAGAGLGLMVLRIFQGEIENIENLPPREIYKPLAAAALPAALGASVAALAGWEMPVSQAQLLIGSAGWGMLTGFGVGLGVQPQGVLPHVLAVGGGLVGGTIGAAINRLYPPSSGAVALFNSVVLWSAHVGALSWAYLLRDHPSAAFFGQPSVGRTGQGGWAMFGSTLIGAGLGAAISSLPPVRRLSLSRQRLAFIDLSGLAGGLTLGGIGLFAGHAQTGSWLDAAQIAVPCALSGIGVGLVAGVLLTRKMRALPVETSRPLAQRPEVRVGLPGLYIGPDGLGGTSALVGLFDGRF